MNKNKIKSYVISMLGLNPGDFQKKPKIYDALYLLHSGQKKVLNNFIRENLLGLKNLTLLDLGSGIKPYKSLFHPYVSNYIGSDANTYEGVDIVCSAEKISLPGQSCNVVLALQLLEHTNNPLKVLNEINRLLTKDGCAFISIPACFCYHPGVEHYKPGMVVENPVYPDYWRWTQAGIMKLIGDNFTYRQIKIEAIGGFFQCFGLQLAFLITESAKSINNFFGYPIMFTITPFINIVSFCLDKIFYKWNKLMSPYTVFLGYAITIKK